MAEKVFHAVGKRKTACARVYLTAGEGKIVVNERGFEEYFTRPTSRMVVMQPFELTGTVGKWDVTVNVYGSGPAAQASATRHGISKALLEIDLATRGTLKKAGLLTRDSRQVERKKYGQSGARKRYQFSKR
ncbi:MAG: 30S ribosomal protein S9 [Deltaproteobacteria bacterium]|nr:30S ribosomal protein S9 [Deltaproteobacteria bacterium]